MALRLINKYLQKKEAGKGRKFVFARFCAPDEIRTHIDGTGNHNSIR